LSHCFCEFQLTFELISLEAEWWRLASCDHWRWR
jgi:hypothetical protein